MNLESVFNHGMTVWVIIPLLIFTARILDVSLGTLRIIFVSRGLKYLAPVVGFFEVIIWLVAIRAVMQNLNNIVCYIAYGAGFAMGTFIGLFIEKRLAIGKAMIRIVTQMDATELIDHLRSQGFGMTSVEAEGKSGRVHVLFSIIRRCDFEKMTEIIRKFNPKAFYTLEDVNFVSKGTFPYPKALHFKKPMLGPFRFWRKSK